VSRAITIFVLVILSVSAGFAADPTFSIKDVPSVSGVSYVLTADFNRDNIADIGVLGGGGFSVQLGKGDGTFGSPITTSVGVESNTVVTGDVNGDGIPDIVAGGDQLAVLLGIGDGTFRPGSILTGSSPGLADFNKDGKLDLAFVASGTINIALGDGDGTFGPPTNVGPSGMFPSVGPLITGDFDGDGKPDIAFDDCCDPQTEAAPISHLTVLYGNGAGGIASTYIEQGAAVAFLRTVDFNKDGIDDFAESWSGCHTPCMGLTVHLGNATRQPQSLTAIEEPSFDTFVPGPGVAADFNGDGRNDIAFSDTNFYPMDASATQTNAVFASLQQGDGTPAVTPLMFNVGTTISVPDNIATADFNRDGKPDLVTVKAQDTLAVMLNTTGGSSGGGGTTSPADFAVGVSPTEETVTAGSSATAKVSVTGTNGFNGAVSLTCSGLPAGASCSFNPASVNPGGTSTLTITTTSAGSGASASLRSAAPWYALWLPLVGIVFTSGRLTRKQLIALLAMGLLGILLLQACGGGNSGSGSNLGGNASGGTGGDNGGSSGGNGGSSGGSSGGSNSTPAGQYAVTITGTSGSTQHTTTFNLIVQ
jgi:hypothetical protein